MFELGAGYRSQVQFLPPLADSRDFPAPVVRATPGGSQLASTAQRRWPDMAAVRLVDRARTALFLVAQYLAPARIWVPAYHCPAMIEPFLAAACEVRFYPVTVDLSPEAGYLEQRLQRGDALVAVRYFGFDCGIHRIADLCRERDVRLIEDLAHAAYAHAPCGDFAVTSLVKFLPITGGAELILPDTGAATALDRLHGSLPGPARVRFRQQARRVGRRLGLLGSDGSEYRYFDPRRIQRGVPHAIESVIRQSDHEAICSRRQQNFRYLYQHLKDSALGRPLFDDLPGQVVPYVFPFLLHEVETFGHVRRGAVQALRWEELAPTPCDVSETYRGRLIQLPVHQGLDAMQMQRMVDYCCGN
ncbi:MAG: DegT/DnrJ/EryC1/StrS family aminotransferase [Halieaceae bacterium]|nr:DegT/DnrJ/EryC1/StrS family aminotransferase [Halieaceae bacterium]